MPVAPSEPDAVRAVRRRFAWCFAAVGALAALAFLFSFCIGKYPLTVEEIGAILFGGEVGQLKRDVFLNLRVPRAVMSFLTGVGLGLAGSVYQIIFKNPLAAPDIIGVSSGANLGAAVAVVVFGGSTMLLASSAFVGGLLVTFMVIALVRMTDRNSMATYILAGVVMKAVSESFIMMLKFFADPEKELAAIEYWSMGSFSNMTASKLAVVFPLFAVGLAGVVLLRRQVTLLGLQEDESRMLGVRVRGVRIGVLAFSTLMVTSTVCVTGLIAFVGLIAPHIARLLLKRNSFPVCVFASLVGGVILLVADVFARTIYSAEVPISILTTLVGVPFLLYFIMRRQGGDA
ncbi:MAG: iron ABC transporter permease [Acidobacteriota bacterium]|jgi:iron complex transport system permease protein|nr:iron ABC transporter permease [Acidobacteriota bacterium]